MRTLLDPSEVSRGLRRVAGELLERHKGGEDLVVIGIRRGGVPVAEELIRWLAELENKSVPFGTVDITLYRDDAATALPNPRIGPSQVPVSLDGARVVLVDDVLYTGRTIRAALDALLDYGRPRSIELLVLVDRGGRELPIQADYAVKRVEIAGDERVDVVGQKTSLRAVVESANVPTTPPEAP
jgi:pyrimidine operon attenuation protein / uracil phosphoribosyltransferase